MALERRRAEKAIEAARQEAEARLQAARQADEQAAMAEKLQVTAATLQAALAAQLDELAVLQYSLDKTRHDVQTQEQGNKR
jgi:hypothetical protein